MATKASTPSLMDQFSNMNKRVEDMYKNMTFLVTDTRDRVERIRKDRLKQVEQVKTCGARLDEVNKQLATTTRAIESHEA